MWQLNLRGWAIHSAELTARLRLAQTEKTAPDLFCLNETLLDRTTENLLLEGYTLVARRDRGDGQGGGGGVAVFARQALAN